MLWVLRHKLQKTWTFFCGFRPVQIFLKRHGLYRTCKSSLGRKKSYINFSARKETGLSLGETPRRRHGFFRKKKAIFTEMREECHADLSGTDSAPPRTGIVICQRLSHISEFNCSGASKARTASYVRTAFLTKKVHWLLLSWTDSSAFSPT